MSSLETTRVTLILSRAGKKLDISRASYIRIKEIKSRMTRKLNKSTSFGRDVNKKNGNNEVFGALQTLKELQVQLYKHGTCLKE